MSNKPRPYELSKPEELKRLYHELCGYMRVSQHHGTDMAGRRYAYEALLELTKSPAPPEQQQGEP